MPELPEVTVFRQYFDQIALHKKVIQVEVLEPRVVTVPPEELANQLIGQTLVATERIGKHLLVELSSGRWLTLHFGMTGSLRYFKDREDQPRFTKVRFDLNDSFSLAFRCPRILGRIGLADSVAAYTKQKKLGSDALTVTLDAFQKLLRNRTGLLKPLLLNQRFLAGLGNWIVDEILYQAAIHPTITVNRLTDEQINTIYEKMQHILETAIEHEAQYHLFPRNFLVTYRWRESDDKDHPMHQQNIQRIVVGGRGTYYDADRQIMP